MTDLDPDQQMLAQIRYEADIQKNYDSVAYGLLTNWLHRIEALSAENKRLREALVSSTKCLRETASRVGSMHGYWDIIFDNESILKSLGDTK